MTDAAKCPNCGIQATFKGPRDGDRSGWFCGRCGEFELTGTAESILRTRQDLPRPLISGWIQDQNRAGVTPSLDGNNVNALGSLTRPSLRERLDRYLLAAGQLSPTLGGDFNASHDALVGVSYSDTREMGFIVHCLTVKGLIEHRPGGAYRLTPDAYIAVDELRSRRTASSQGFVAMWFADEMTPAYDNGFALAIKNAGYEPFHIGRKEHANKIDDEIIAEIRRSAFVVADFTGHRGGVYFEAGFAMGLRLPVIWTCRKDELAKLHFDIRQYNCLDWESIEELAQRLQLRIEAILGAGPLKKT